MWRVSEHVAFFTASNAPFFVTVKRCPICLVDTRTLLQTKFGTAASVPSCVLRPSKHTTIKNVQDQIQSAAGWHNLAYTPYVLPRSARMKKQITAPHEVCHARIHITSGQEIDEQATEADKAQQPHQRCARVPSEPRIANDGRQSLIK